jgi:hypothetical protein
VCDVYSSGAHRTSMRTCALLCVCARALASGLARARASVCVCVFVHICAVLRFVCV